MQVSPSEGSSQRSTHLQSPLRREVVNISQSMQGRVKKRPRSDQNSEVSKREKLSEENDAKRECPMKFTDFASIADRCEGLTNVSLIDQLFQVMLQEQSDNSRRPVETMSRRTLLSKIIAATEKEVCLAHFVQLGGLRILNDWLQEAHKGKLGDGNSKDRDRALEELLLTLLLALGKLPVDLDALRNCIVGKSVNKLRTHKNSEIQKKARELVDLWKERVNAEMKSSDEGKIGTSTACSSRLASDVQNPKMRGPKSNLSSKPVSINSNVAGSKEHSSSVVSSGALIKPLATSLADASPVVKDEKSCSSSQSQNNSQSWCSGSAKGGGSFKDEVKPTSVSMVNRNSESMSRRHANSIKSHSTVILRSPHKDRTAKQKEKPNGTQFSDKGTNEGGQTELNNQRLIVRLPNPGRSPSHSISGESVADGSATSTRGSPPWSLPRHDHTCERNRLPSHAPVNIVDTKCGMSNGADIKEDSNKTAFRISNEEKGCKQSCFEQRWKDAVGKCTRDKILNSINSSHEVPTLDVAQGRGIDLLASVAAGEVIESEKSSSGSSAGEGLPMSLDQTKDASKQGQADMNSNCEVLNEGVQNMCEKLSSLTEESDQLADSPMKGHLPTAETDSPMKGLVPAEEKFSGDGLSTVATQPMPMGHSMLKEASPIAESGIESSICDVEQRDTNSSMRESEILLVASPNHLASRGQSQVARESSFMDEDCRGTEEVAGSCSPVAVTRDLDSRVCYEDDALELARQVAMEVEQEVEKYDKHEVEDVKLANPPINIPHRENSDALSDETTPGRTDAVLLEHKSLPKTTDCIQLSATMEVLTESTTVTTEMGKCISERSSNQDEITHHLSNDVALGQSTMNLVGASKEVSDVKQSVSMISMKDEVVTFTEPAAESKLIHTEKTPTTEGGFSESRGKDRPLFDLNEGLVVDDALQSSSACTSFLPPVPAVPCSDSPSRLASQASSLAAPVAVMAATNGAFIPPSLTRTKSDLGWKGSASTSAFRPAEPRRVHEALQTACDAAIHMHTPTESANESNRKGTRMLDIDLNVADETALEDSLAVANLPMVSEVRYNTSVASRPDLDLNKMDGNDEQKSTPASVSRCSDVDMPRTVPPSAAPRAVLDFDLNDWVGFDEDTCSQPGGPEKPAMPAADGMGHTTDAVRIAPWHSSVSSVPVGMVMPMISSSGRLESSQPLIVNPVSKPPISADRTFGPFSNNLYRGAAVSTSSVPYVGPIPSSFSYGGFTLGAGFPFTSASYNVGSHLGSSVSSPPFLTASPSQIVNAGAVVSAYGRPYIMGSSRDISCIDSNISWARPCLDLNSGPDVSVDALDNRDINRPNAVLNQLSYSQAVSLGGSSKRKEPEGNFDPFRSNFKQVAWK
ncbi:hypothetical protein KP509_11G079200 [Ceratopteris richardii]|uniref:TFIIS N-terminal domain-containing protein n=1 Tax=Ceratopteris richardii TaxID=49495 RepID=A0A8T2TUL9_CERRI|nr:hypothetical protein KP509_11G079200 [Ceratopteris richardii]KAH7425951.1 hypothetical protein KP509_11G079200 [Ceratopteris richardii]KAH7425952.1 hypothetical protein KP509_11G079200 [Ceratopteris richardii]KAH7425953.1 hypothetical protein KP509_11G079200 [Ceratopteris richardii]KAH7425954.1 hypothetical protein KP509_11G079200 [Ceratopteris richardii]